MHTHFEHPSDWRLREFLNGLVEPAGLEEIARHLDECPDCLQRVSQIDDESPLVGLLCRATGRPQSADATISERDDRTTPACEEAAHALDLGSSRYDVIEEIARGGMGAVLRVHDRRLDRVLALKVILDDQDAPATRERFLREAGLCGRLQHPGVVPVHELSYFDDGRPFFTMKLVEGQTLAELLRQRTDLHDGRPRLLQVFEQICQTMAYAHSQGVIHRDLKPANVMVGEFGEVQIMDWGLAKQMRKAEGGGRNDDRNRGFDSQQFHSTHSGAVAGTPAYMPPEQARGEIDNLDERADVFALGAILCEILTGRPPYAREDSRVLLTQAKQADLRAAIEQLNNAVADPELTALAKACLQSLPDDRPRDAGQVAERMDAYLLSIEERAQRAEVERAQAETRVVEQRKRRRVQLALAMILLTAIVGGAMLWRSRQSQRLQNYQDQWTVVNELRAKAETADIADPQPWRDALARARPLATSLGKDPLDRDLLGAVENTVQSLERARVERELLQQLTRAYRLGDSFDLREGGVNPDEKLRAYAKVFGKLGITVGGTSVEEAAGRLQRLPDPVRRWWLVVVDDWIAELVRFDLESDGGQPWLQQLVLACDPDPVRRELRERMWTDAESLNELVLREETRRGGAAPSLPDTDQEGRSRGVPAEWLVPAPEELFQFAVLGQSADMLSLVSRHLFQNGSPEIGERLMQYALRRDPDDFWLNLHLGNWAGRREPQQGVRYLSIASALRPHDVAVMADLAGALLAAQRPAEAADIGRQIIERQPDFADGHNILGVAFMQQQRWDEAAAAFRRAIGLRPDMAEAHCNLGMVFEAKGDLKQATARYREAVRQREDSGEAHQCLGSLLARQGSWDEAAEHFRAAVRHRPQLVDAHLGLAAASAARKEWEQAAASYREAIRYQPDSAAAHYYLGDVLGRQNKLDEAIASLRTAVRLAPGDARSHFQLGQFLLNNKQTDEAADAFRKAAELRPDYAEAHCNLGVVLMRMGRPREALPYLQRGHQLGSARAGWPYPSDQWLEQAREQIRLLDEAD